MALDSGLLRSTPATLQGTVDLTLGALLMMGKSWAVIGNNLPENAVSPGYSRG
jgi:hypothetical protein